VAKELLPLGAYPALAATLLEVAAAGVRELVVVTAKDKDKPQIGRFLAALTRLSSDPAALTATTPAAAALARLITAHGLRFQLAEQPEPLGVLDAVARGRALTALPYAVLFPDLLHLPDQTALSRLAAAHAACGQAVIGLRRAEPTPAGNTVAVTVPPEFGQRLAQGLLHSEPLPLCGVGPARGLPGELVTTFGQIHTPALEDAIVECCRAQPGAPLADSAFVHALDRLARAKGLYGVLLPGQVLDLGSLPGYLDAATRFLSGAARLRGLP
jgi:UTP-glucose-1-phosphate uridylyltransferase